MGRPHQTVLRPHCWCAALVGSVMLVAGPAALAQDATWRTTPASGDFSTPTNWTPGAVPTGFATFGGSSVTTLTFSASRNIDGFIFDPGAPAYTFNLNSGFTLHFNTDGIINNSGNAPTFNVSNSPLVFDNSSTAGNAIINLNAGTVQFLSTSTAGTAQLNAAAGTTFDFTGTTGPANNGVFSAGSISGAGNFDLGVNHRLVVGSNDLSTTVSGTISSGAITKVGAGTLTLSGGNTYAGGTTLVSGALMIGNDNALGSGDLSMAPGTTLSFDTAAAYTIANNISIAGDPIFDVGAGPAQTVSGIISDTDPVNNPGIVEKNGAGTLILSGANTYSGGTIINAGTLQVTNSTPGTSSSVGVGDVTLNGGTFQADGFSNLTFSNNFKINTAGGAVDNNGTILRLSGIISNGNGATGVLQLTDFSGGFGTTVLSGANTYSGGTMVVGTTVQVTKGSTGTSSSVGTGTVTLEDGQFRAGAASLTFSNNFAINNTLAGSAIDNNNRVLTLSGNITDGNGPGMLTFVNSFSGPGPNPNARTILTGASSYTGGTVICDCAAVQLGDATHTASIIGKITNEGQFRILNADTTGITRIVNTGMTGFFNTTSASTATIVNRALLEFANQSTAGGATIRNTGGTEFLNHSMAGNATIINRNGGLVSFADNSTADGATIRNVGSAVEFLNHGTAGSATIINRDSGLISFANNSTAGDATITTRQFAQTFFEDHSNGDNARFITNGTGVVDFSGTTGAGGLHQITAGSIEGSGSYFIGSGNTLAVGSNNLSTEVSGVIADFSCGCSPGPGTLEKVGTGTLTLSGTNSYTGGTTITAGTLQLGNGTDSTGSILGSVTNNATLAFNRPNSYQFDGVISGSGAVQQNGPGTTTLTAVNTYAGPTTINAGLLALSGAGSIANSSGVIDNDAFDISATTAGASIKNLSGGGIVTLGNQTLTLTNASGTFAGSIGGNGGLVKQGPGLFVLSGTNTYLGATAVAGGDLRVNGSVASAVTVQSGATLSGVGSVAGLVTVLSGGTLSAGQSPGTLTLGALNLNAGSTSVFELGSPGVVGGPTNDLVNVTGNLTLGGTLSVNAPSAGYYRLFNYGTLTPSNFAAVSGSSNGTPTVLTNVPNQVNLLIANAGQQIQFWDGADQTGNGVVNGGTGTWNAANTNWTGAPGQANFNDQWRSSVGVFAGTAGTVTIAGAQAFDTLQFSTTGYVLNAGAGGQLQLAGLSDAGTINTDNGVVATINAAIVNGSSHSLTKVGGGTLILTAANTYTGGTTISGGTLQLGNGGATGSIIGNVIDNGVFAINRSDAFTFAGVISGSGAFDQIGSGTTTLGGANTYTGATTISAGGLTIAGGGSITSDVTNNAAFNNFGTVTGNLANAGTASNDKTITGAVNNSGTFNNNTAGTVGGGLTNTAGTTTNTGTINGGANISGGTLNTMGTINGGLINSAIVNANGAINGAVANNANGTFNVAAGVTVGGTFDNAAGASLAIASTGAAFVQGLLTNSGVVTVADMGQFNAAGGITNKAGGTITIGKGATVLDDLNNAGSVTNNGTYVANVASNTGLITNNSAWTGNLVSNSGMIANSGFWIGTVSNAGTFINPGFVEGLFTNTAGVAVNDGFLTAGARVTGGMLTGSGFVIGDLTLAGGTFLPGNGTPGSSMRVEGNLAFQSGALYLVQLNPATSTFATVSGTASLNGSAGAAFLAGNYVAKRYTILTANGGVSGAFGSFDTLGIPSGFKASLSYDAKDVFLNLALSFVPPPGSGLNVNQQNAANAIVGFFNSNGGIPVVFGGLTPAGLTQASGELATGSQQTTFDAMNLFLGLLTDPFVAGRGDGLTAGASAPQFAEESDAASAYAANGKARSKSERDAYAAIYRKAPLRDVYDPRWSVWSAGYGGSQTTDGNAALGSNNTRSSIGAVAVGADYRFSPNLLAGFAMAGGGTNFSVTGSGTGRSDLFQAGAFARYTAGPAYVSAALAYGWQNVTTDRTVTIAGTDLLHANFNANTWSGRVEGGYRFVAPWMGGVGITPYAAGQFTTFDLPAYAEQALAGANTFALTYGAKSVTDSRSELGIRTDKSFAMPNGIFTLRGRAAWAHDFNPDRNIGATFQTLPGASFVVNGALQASDSALVTASAEMKWLNGFSLAATFEGAFSGVTSSYAGKGVARYAW
jgi:fibronectin-binding autotransporter adhesin